MYVSLGDFLFEVRVYDPLPASLPMFAMPLDVRESMVGIRATSDLFCLLLLPSLLLSCCPPLLFLPPLLLHLPPSLLGTAVQLLLHAPLFVLQRLQQL